MLLVPVQSISATPEIASSKRAITWLLTTVPHVLGLSFVPCFVIRKFGVYVATMIAPFEQEICSLSLYFLLQLILVGF